MQLNKHHYILFSCIGVFILFSCKKDGHGNPGVPVGPSGPDGPNPFSSARVRTKVTGVNTATYTYDSIGRISMVQYNAGDKQVYTYMDSTILEDYYSPQGDLTWQRVYNFDSHGLVTYNTDSRTPGKYYVYEYDGDRRYTGVFTFNVSTPDTLSKDVYYYSNGNQDSVKYFSGDGSSTGAEYFLAYYTDKFNSLTTENFGDAWAGASNRNLIKTYWDGVDDQHKPRIYTRKYEFDEMGRVIKETTEGSGFNGYPTIYTYY